jgi:hypothetical protein
MEDAVLAQMRAAAELDDHRFKEVLPTVIQVSTGKAGVVVGDRLRIKCVALLVSRYAKSASVPEYPDLRDASVSVIGNPWLHKVRWDAHVILDNGRPDQYAWEMVDGWLKARLIQDFFELLSEEGTGDRRRLDYWLRFAPFVDDMWFALGPYAQTRVDAKFRAFKDRARGRLLGLEATTSDNNAFVMRIGTHLAIEFGSKNNAFFLLEWGNVPVAVANALRNGKIQESINISSLKPSVRVVRRNHRDAPIALKSWEQKFDDDLLPILGIRLDKRPACVPDLEELLKGRDIVVVDTRASGGSLKLTPHERLAPIARQLAAVGMARFNRGWFKD